MSLEGGIIWVSEVELCPDWRHLRKTERECRDDRCFALDGHLKAPDQINGHGDQCCFGDGVEYCYELPSQELEDS